MGYREFNKKQEDKNKETSNNNNKTFSNQQKQGTNRLKTSNKTKYILGVTILLTSGVLTLGIYKLGKGPEVEVRQDRTENTTNYKEDFEKGGGKLVPETANSEQVQKFDSLDFFKDVLKTDEEGVRAYFAKKGVEYQVYDTEAEAIEKFLEMGKIGIIPDELKEGITTENRPFTYNKGKTLVFSYVEESGLSDGDYIDIIVTANEMGYSKVYAYSDDMVRFPVTFFKQAKINEGKTDAEILALQKDMHEYKNNSTDKAPQFYLIEENKLNRKDTLELTDKNSMLNMSNKVIDGEYYE